MKPLIDSKIFLEKVSSNIEHIRLLQKKTIKEMAVQLQLTNSGYRNLERGITDISISKLCQIATVLNVEINVLFNIDNPFHLRYNNSNSEEIIDQLKSSIQHQKEEIAFLRKQLELIVMHKS
ncbi:helix-turn-helix domain-containing protein [Ferruginibacter albus]|uniref:helix-turn-helix domain-containing protein n=1 Tax=Ferruginibacter albus TaxID=2875540 RepID=UPI001CC4F464|nr:helix-turn-helix transcriptional regulator [Ferruginibacter albus]UAY53262.1 helix-turn-helix domain-containing protein [Ferruginibacter albus]